MRRVLENLSRGVVLKRRLPKRFGGASIFVSPDASLQFWKPTLESSTPLFESVAELVKPGDVIWDIGANVGLFSFSAAYLAGPTGRVLAVEPDSFLSGLLHRSAATLPANCAAVDVLSIAVSDSVGIARLNIAKRGRAANSLGAGSSQTGGFRASQSTLCLTLDWLLRYFPAPKVVKIDVEGLELSVLRGATTVLTEARPRIHCEIRTDPAFDLLKSYGYALFDADQPMLARRALERRAYNTVALPS
jgi:FkbM family methyltransferase